MTTVEAEEREILEAIEQRKLEEELRKKNVEEEEKAYKLEEWRAEKKERTKVLFDTKIQQYNDKKDTQTFASHFHKSRAGVEYLKQNPVVPPSEEVLMRMTQRINRSLGQSEKDVNNQNGGRSGERNQMESNDNPIVALEPEEAATMQRSIDRSKKFKSVAQSNEEEEEPGANGLSLYQQEKQYLMQLEQEKILKAEEHHVIKTKDFNVYGKLRTEKPFVKSTQKSNAQSDLNEKFITTECITDRRVKIASMSNRQYTNAPSVEQVRKQGQHQMILQAINKKQTFSELINQANSMVTSVLHDSMKRSVNILPSVCKFGALPHGVEAEMTLTVKNEDSMSQRIQIKPTQDRRIVVKQETYGPIAPGMTKKVLVQLQLANSTDTSRVKEEIVIMTKSDHYKVPVEALLLSEAEYDQREQQSFEQTGKGLASSRVRNKLTDSIKKSRVSVVAAFK